jgi:NitT/TauT family transport system permease protein
MSLKTDPESAPNERHATGGARPVGARLVRRLWSRDVALRVGILAAVLAAWQWFGEFLIGVNWVSSPSLVFQRLVSMARDGSLARNTGATLQETLLGLIVGILLGVVGGILIARAPTTVAKAIDPYLIGVYSLPRVALAPFFILWFGIGLVSKVVLVVSVVGFVVLFNVRQGMESVDVDIMDALRSMRANRWEMIRYVIIPSLVPWILSSVKIAVGIGFVSAVVGEMVGSTKGLGWYVTQSLNQFDMTGGVTSLIIMAVLALILYSIVGAIERRVCRWQVSSTAARTVTM